MRAILMFVLAGSISLNVAYADFRGPYLVMEKRIGEKRNSPTSKPQTITRCEVFLDRIVVTRGTEDLVATTEKKIALKGTPIQYLLGEAAKGPLKTVRHEQSAETWSYRGALLQSDGVEWIDLGSRQSGQTATVNESREAYSLAAFLNQNCE